MALPLEMAKEIIFVLREKNEHRFDSHDFIMQLIQIPEYERWYVQRLAHYAIGNVHGIFKHANSEIGRCLSTNSEKLGIVKDDRRISLNIKGNETENQCWRFISDHQETNQTINRR
ncbi:MAG: hypothetical protein J6X27_03680 [Bacteroidaceae bacterium]|nr:hypothetical protein [Bacteroidaceae bacterium]